MHVEGGNPAKRLMLTTSSSIFRLPWDKTSSEQETLLTRSEYRKVRRLATQVTANLRLSEGWWTMGEGMEDQRKRRVEKCKGCVRQMKEVLGVKFIEGKSLHRSPLLASASEERV